MIAELLICGAALGAFDPEAFSQRVEADLKESGCIFRAAVQWSLEKVTKDEAVDLALDCMGVTAYRDGEDDCPCDPVGTFLGAGLPDCPPGEYSIPCPESDMQKRVRRLVEKWEAEGRLKPSHPTFDPGWGECGVRVAAQHSSSWYLDEPCVFGGEGSCSFPHHATNRHGADHHARLASEDTRRCTERAGPVGVVDATVCDGKAHRYTMAGGQYYTGPCEARNIGKRWYVMTEIIHRFVEGGPYGTKEAADAALPEIEARKRAEWGPGVKGERKYPVFVSLEDTYEYRENRTERQVRLACPAGHLTTRKVKGDTGK